MGFPSVQIGRDSRENKPRPAMFTAATRAHSSVSGARSFTVVVSVSAPDTSVVTSTSASAFTWETAAPPSARGADVAPAAASLPAVAPADAASTAASPLRTSWMQNPVMSASVSATSTPVHVMVTDVVVASETSTRDGAWLGGPSVLTRGVGNDMGPSPSSLSACTTNWYAVRGCRPCITTRATAVRVSPVKLAVPAALWRTTNPVISSTKRTTEGSVHLRCTALCVRFVTTTPTTGLGTRGME